jgi:hypothetical protein
MLCVPNCLATNVIICRHTNALIQLSTSIQPSQCARQVSPRWLYWIQSSWKPQNKQFLIAFAVCGHFAPFVQIAYFLFYKFLNYVYCFFHSCTIYSAAEHPNVFQLCCFQVLWCKSAHSVCNLIICLVNILLRLLFWNILPVWTEQTVKFVMGRNQWEESS